MKDQSNIREELRELAPDLLKINKKDNPFIMPEGYLSTLQKELKEKIENESALSSVRSGHKSIVRNMRTWWSVVAAVAVLAIGAWFFTPKSTDQLVATTELSSEEALAFVDANIDDYELEEIVDLYELEGEGLDENNETIIDEYIDDLDLEDIEELL